MKSPITRFSIAAVIIAAVVIGLMPSTCTLAGVVAQMNEIKTYQYQMVTSLLGPDGKEKTFAKALIRVNTELGMKMTWDIEFPLRERQEVYIQPSQQTITTMMTNGKRYTKSIFDADAFAGWQARHDPRTVVTNILGSNYVSIGYATMDGIKVKGFQTREPDTVLPWEDDIETAWVNIETDLPVRIESSTHGTPSLKTVLYDFQWDSRIEDSEFNPVIPDDYTVGSPLVPIIPEKAASRKTPVKEEVADPQATQDDADIKRLWENIKEVEATEAVALEGLTLLKDLTTDYPDELSVMGLMEYMNEALLGDTPTAQAFRGRDSDKREARRLARVQAMITLQGLASFFQTLEDAAYYGRTVKPEFSHAVLLRWNTAHDTYRVIFADLNVRNVTSTELLELEAMPLNVKPHALAPQPQDGSVAGSSLSGLELRWMSGFLAVKHRVYFGTTPDSLSLLASVAESAYSVSPTLTRDTQYYWRIDEIQADGSVTPGDVWSFNTGRLVAWWSLDEGTGESVRDSSGNNHGGQIQGNPIWTEGIRGRALQFDGDGDRVDIATGSDFNTRNQVSISAWFKVGPSDTSIQTLLAKGFHSWRIQIDKQASCLKFACRGVIVDGSTWGKVRGQTAVTDSQWHHVVGVYDGQQISLHSDGKLDATVAGSGQINITNAPVTIGKTKSMRGRFWRGAIDEVRIYDYALSEREILALYQEHVK